MELALLFTWIDFVQIVTFTAFAYIMYRRGHKAGRQAEKDERDFVTRVVNTTLKRLGHDE